MPNMYHHTDVHALTREDALEQAINNKCHWRWIDSFDSSKNKYVTYEILG